MLFAKNEMIDPPEDYREPFAKCGVCGDLIREGDTHYQIDGTFIHSDCLDELPRKEILKLLGIMEETA